MSEDLILNIYGVVMPVVLTAVIGSVSIWFAIYGARKIQAALTLNFIRKRFYD